MPVTKTATRALRKSKVRELENKTTRAQVKDIVRDSKKFASGKKTGESQEFLNKAYKTIDKAAKKNVIHTNKAARLKARIGKVLFGKKEAEPES